MTAEVRVQPPALVEGGIAAGERADERADGGRALDAAAGGRGRASAAAAGRGRAPDAAVATADGRGRAPDAAAAPGRGLAPRRALHGHAGGHVAAIPTPGTAMAEAAARMRGLSRAGPRGGEGGTASLPIGSRLGCR